MRNDICCLIPSYNEATSIGTIVKRLRDGGYAVYVVDDGSTDATASIAESEGGVVIRHKTNLGKGAALREGFKRVMGDGYDAVIVMDGDNQHEINDIPFFIDMAAKSDAGLIIGNRMLDTSSMPRVRRIVNRFMSYLLSNVAGQEVPDSQCGFRLIKKEALAGIRLESSNFEIESEMILKAAWAGFKIESVPIKTVYRNETSKVHPFFDTLRFIAFMVKSLMSRQRSGK